MVSIRAMSGMVGAKSAPNAAGRAERSGHGPRESFLYDADAGGGRIDRKSIRLNSSHRCISYAVFCLKKKNIRAEDLPPTKRRKHRRSVRDSDVLRRLWPWRG